MMKNASVTHLVFKFGKEHGLEVDAHVSHKTKRGW